MIQMTINGKIVKAAPGEMLLAVIRRQGIDVPALCDHAAIEPCGSCRMCLVEITREDWKGWKRYVTSCLYPAEDGLIVTTHTPEIQEIRRTIIDLYMARCPGSDVIQRMGEEYGLTKTSFATIPEGNNCIMCYACTRICEVLGRSAISAVYRGHDKVISGPFGNPPPDCIGCLSCAHICPTDVIEWHDQAGTRTIWEKSFDLISCSLCGKNIITVDFAEYLRQKRDIPPEYFNTCDDCKRVELARKMGGLVDLAKEVAS